MNFIPNRGIELMEVVKQGGCVQGGVALEFGDVGPTSLSSSLNTLFGIYFNRLTRSDGNC